MVGEWGQTLPPDEMAGSELAHAIAEKEPPHEKLPPGQWVRKNLFSSWFNGILTVVFGLISVYLAYRFFRFVFVTGRWEPVRVNLELFMIGTYPRDERWRLVAQLIIASGGIGAVVGSLRAMARDRAEETGEPEVRYGWRTYLASYWAAGLFVLVMLVVFCDTIGPWLLAGGCVLAFVVGRFLTAYLPRRLRMWGWTFAALLLVVEMQVLTGTGGWAWFYTSLAFLPVISDESRRLLDRSSDTVGWVLGGLTAVIGVGVAVVNGLDLWGLLAIAYGLAALAQALTGNRIAAGQMLAFAVVGLVVSQIYLAIGLEGVDWSEWGGFHLNIIATVVAIVLAFPLGVLLALGRRSELPALRVMSITYIEFFRGAPLITFLLAAQFFLGFFLDSDTPLSLISRAIAAVTLFSAAYVAEIIRGGLAAVPNGQIEAGQAGGLSQLTIMRLIVMPQALRAVIPAMVGQFISLFKDTTLFTIIGITEFLGVREIVHSQAAFRGFGIGETLVFVAFGFWALAFTMSRESQRLERRLGVGER